MNGKKENEEIKKNTVSLMLIYNSNFNVLINK